MDSLNEADPTDGKCNDVPMPEHNESASVEPSDIPVRVKTEPGTGPTEAVDATDEPVVPEGFFDDLLPDENDVPDIKIEPTGPLEQPTDDDPIPKPEHFFDDLLSDERKRAEQAQKEGAEIKFCVQLKQLEQVLREIASKKSVKRISDIEDGVSDDNRKCPKHPRISVRSEFTASPPAEDITPNIPSTSAAAQAALSAAKSKLTADSTKTVRGTPSEVQVRAVQRVSGIIAEFEKAARKERMQLFTDHAQKAKSMHLSVLLKQEDFSLKFNALGKVRRKPGIIDFDPRLGRVGRVIGFDTDRLQISLQTHNIPDSFLIDPDEIEIDECASSSTKATKSTQTAQNACDCGAQSSRAGQSSAQVNAGPLTAALSTLNENQLLAVDDFIQLILEPAASNAAEMYEVRKRLMDIYKSAIQPSTLLTEALPVNHRGENGGRIINLGFGSNIRVLDPRQQVDPNAASVYAHRRDLHQQPQPNVATTRGPHYGLHQQPQPNVAMTRGPHHGLHQQPQPNVAPTRGPHHSLHQQPQPNIAMARGSHHSLHQQPQPNIAMARGSHHGLHQQPQPNIATTRGPQHGLHQQPQPNVAPTRGPHHGLHQQPQPNIAMARGSHHSLHQQPQPNVDHRNLHQQPQPNVATTRGPHHSLHQQPQPNIAMARGSHHSLHPQPQPNVDHRNLHQQFAPNVAPTRGPHRSLHQQPQPNIAMASQRNVYTTHGPQQHLNAHHQQFPLQHGIDQHRQQFPLQHQHEIDQHHQQFPLQHGIDQQRQQFPPQHGIDQQRQQFSQFST